MKRFIWNDNKKRLIYSDDNIEIYNNGYLWDFVWYIVNKTDKDIKLVYSADTDVVWAEIKANNWVGLFGDDENYAIISTLLGNKRKDNKMWKVEIGENYD